MIFFPLRRWRGRQDGTAICRHGGTTDEIHLAADSADLGEAHGFRCGLAHQIDLDAGIDGDNIVLFMTSTGLLT